MQKKVVEYKEEKIMLVGILSMQRIVNYGSFMQAYSLKKMVESLGHKVIFIDYRTNVLVEDRDNSKKKKDLFYQEIKDGVKFHILRKYGEQQKKFIECYSTLGISKYKVYNKKVDVLIVGSDEVFNCTQRNPKVGFAVDFFGENSKAKKLITYAASFGSTTYEKICFFNIEQQIKRDLNRFAAISVRDQNSYNIIKKLCNRESILNLDPVLVSGVEKEAWKEPTLKGYVIVYGYANRFSGDEKKEITRFAHKNGLKTISLCDYQDFCDWHIVCRPDEILGYFKNADYIVTDTFHGTIFSVIYHKQFGVFCRAKSNTGSTNQEKLLDLLNRLHLEKQLIEDAERIEDVLQHKINYEGVDLIRESEKSKSINYLRNNLSVSKER